MAVERGQKMPRLDPADNPVINPVTQLATVPDDQPVHVVKVATLVVFISLGVILNYIVVQTVVKNKKYHCSPYFHMISFSIADLCRTICTLTVSLSSVLHQQTWMLSEPACKLSAMVNVIFCYAALFSVLAMSVDRHLSVVHHRYYERRLRRRFLLCAMLVWGCAILMSFPPLFHFGRYVFVPSEAQCTLEYRYMKNNDTLSYLLVNILAIGAMGLIYWRIYVFIRAHRRMRPITYTPAASSDWNYFGPGSTGQAITNWIQGFGIGPPHPSVVGFRNQPNVPTRFQHLRPCKNEHLTRLCVLSTIVYSTLWLPYYFVSVWRLFDEHESMPGSVVVATTWLTFAQISCVPLVYIVCNRSFRKAIFTKEANYVHGEVAALQTLE